MNKLTVIKLPAIAALFVLPILAQAQEPSAPPQTLGPVTPTEPAPDRLLLKVGLTPSRLLPQYRHHGLSWVIAPSVGAEYQLSSHMSLYGQADVDFAFGRRDYHLTALPKKEARVHSGAVGIGVRYYYNQAGRERHNRAHGPFVGNYLALEATTELDRWPLVFYDPYSSQFPPTVYTVQYRTHVTPLFTAYWGLQRRIGQHFLYDANIGLGVIATPTTYNYYGSQIETLYHFGSTLALNIRLYFVR